MSCTCDVVQTRTIHCFNNACSDTKIVEIRGAEKKSRCAEHRRGFAFCGTGAANLYLCEECKADGYAITQGAGGGMFGPHYVLQKDGQTI